MAKVVVIFVRFPFVVICVCYPFVEECFMFLWNVPAPSWLRDKYGVGQEEDCGGQV